MATSEADGNINLPSLGKTTLKRVLNPRITFTCHINNIGMYAFLQKELGHIGRFQKGTNNVLRFIISDIEGIKTIIKLVHGKLRTPKNVRFNLLIDFMNAKYNLSIPKSELDMSPILSNSWFAGFVESDGYFGVKISSFLPKSETRKRSRSESIQILFRLNQRAFDAPNNATMRPIMGILRIFFYNLS
jgi:hypothetical protein